MIFNRTLELARLKSVKSRPRWMRHYSTLAGLIFVSPWVIGFILLKLIPIVAALGFSFTDFHMLTPEATRFIGVTNYLTFLGDREAGASLFSSIGDFLFLVPVEMIVALGLATFFSSERLRAKPLLRTLFFLPSIIPTLAIFFIINGLADPQGGWINRLILEPLHLPATSLFSIFPLVLALWSIGPGFLIMLGAIQGVSHELYEAARVDGAGPIMRYFAITLPIISPAIFFSLVINITNAFGGVVILDRGLPFNQSLSAMESYINFQMFTRTDLGYASALAWVMFLVVMIIILALFYSARYWVYFPEEEDNEVF